MMKLNRFALVAGVLALGVAACGDDVQVVEPTPPQPPPPPPVEATMAPASASVAVGNSVVFAVNASGGVAGEAASWTCSSSNTGIATATSTSAGCSATGVAAGDVTITASVTKSGETVNVGAQLTVTSDAEPTQPPGDPAFVVVGSITGDNDTDVSGLQGRVSVTLNVERGGQEIEELALLVDGEVVASQSFGGGMDMGMTPPEDEAAEQAGVHTFTMSFDSDGYEEHGDHTDVDYMNGEHTISAELEIGVTMADGMHGHETVSSNVVTVEFDNEDFIAASVGGVGDGAMNMSSGQIWYGGPGASVEISALAVLYSGDAVSSLTLLSFCGDDAATDSEAPFSFSLDCDGYTSDEDGDGDKPSFTVGGDDIDVRAKAVYLDFEGPGAPVFRVNRNSRLDGWINGTLALTSTSGRNPDSWLRKLSGSDAGGVEGYTTQLRFGEDFDGALAATPSSSPSLPEASRSNDAYCAIASAVDDLGNESALPDEDDGACEADDDYQGLLDDLEAAEDAVPDGEEPTDAQQDNIDDAIDDLAEAGLLAGVDLEAPMVSFTTNPSSPVRSAREFQVQASDAGRGRSGIHPTPVLARVELRNVDNDVVCGSDIRTKGEEDDSNTEMIPGDPDEDCENTSDELTVTGAGGAALLATTAVFGDGYNEIGYYTFTAQARDKAGNLSEEVNRVHLNDTEGPSVGITARVPSGGFDGPFDVTVLMADDLSLRDVRADGGYKNAAARADPTTGVTHNIRLIESQRIDGFNAPQLTQEHVLQLSDIETLLRLYDVDGTTNGLTYQTPTIPAKVAEGSAAADQAAQTIEATADSLDMEGIAVRLRDQRGAAAHDTASSLRVASSVNPFDYRLPIVPEQVVDDATTDDVDEAEVSTAARDAAIDNNTAIVAAKAIASFAITGFEGDTPTATVTDQMVTDNDVTIDIEVQVHGNARGGGATSTDPLLDFENPFERVDLYVADGSDVLHLVASAVGFSGEYSIDQNRGPGETSNVDLGNDQRVWTYEIEVSADALNSLSRGSSRGTIDRTLRAFGVTGRGTTALVSTSIPIQIESR